MATANFSIAPEDGWVQIAVAPKFIRISTVPDSAPYYLYAGSVAPTSATVGVFVDGDDDPIMINVTATDTFYARTVQQQTDGAKVRLDVLTI